MKGKWPWTVCLQGKWKKTNLSRILKDCQDVHIQSKAEGCPNMRNWESREIQRGLEMMMTMVEVKFSLDP